MVSHSNDFQMQIQIQHTQLIVISFIIQDGSNSDVKSKALSYDELSHMQVYTFHECAELRLFVFTLLSSLPHNPRPTLPAQIFC